MNFREKGLKEFREKKRFILELGQKTFDLYSRTHLMGVLNVTPDSFSDGGKFFKLEEAIKQGLKLAEEGADIIDVGGESTRPGSEPVTIDEELRRVLSVIKQLAQQIDVPISIDTYKSRVAKEALGSGASMVNDISGLRFDPEMKKVIAEHDVPVVLMHIEGTPKNMQESPKYENLLEDIKSYLNQSISIAEEAGIGEDKIIIDPGIGFGKALDDNQKILKNLREFKSLGRPVMIGVSRKSFIGKILDLPTDERLEGSLASMAVAIMNGANILRVHDVKESKRVAKLVDAILKPG